MCWVKSQFINNLSNRGHTDALLPISSSPTIEFPFAHHLHQIDHSPMHQAQSAVANPHGFGIWEEIRPPDGNATDSTQGHD